MAVKLCQSSEPLVHFFEDGVDFCILLELVVDCIIIVFLRDVNVDAEAAGLCQFFHVLDEQMSLLVEVDVRDSERVLDAFRSIWSRQRIGNNITFALKVSNIRSIFGYFR